MGRIVRLAEEPMGEELGSLEAHKRCLEQQIGIRIEGVELPRTNRSARATSELSRISKSLTPIQYPPNATIICIGMRASGKTYLGGFGAAALNRPFIDADVLFNEKFNLGTFVRDHGWAAFREKETQVLKDIMEQYAFGYLVSLGGGVVETEENRALLREYARSKGPVVYVVRDIDEVVAFLETSDRPSYGEPVRDVAKRRQPWFYECSSYELVSYSGDNDVEQPFDVGSDALEGDERRGHHDRHPRDEFPALPLRAAFQEGEKTVDVHVDGRGMRGHRAAPVGAISRPRP